MPITKYSKKAQEKFADHLFAMSTSIGSHILLALLLTPLALSAVALVKGEEISLGFFEKDVSPLTALVFVALYLLALVTLFFARVEAMKIYTRIHPD